jgi:phage head maturation protease
MKHKNGALEYKEFAFKADAVGEDGRFSGYASVFGNVDGGWDVVAKGAFTKSLKAIKESGDPASPSAASMRWPKTTTA